MPRDRGEEIVLARFEDCGIRRRARSNHANDFATHELLAGAGLLHLLADRHFVTSPDQPRDVAIRRVIRHAAHGDRLPAFAIARRKRDLQLARGADRVFVEEFVKIAKAEEQQRMRIARLDGVMLPHQWCRRFGHNPKCPRMLRSPRLPMRLQGHGVRACAADAEIGFLTPRENQFACIRYTSGSRRRLLDTAHP